MDQNKTSYSAILGVILLNLRKQKELEQGEVAERMGLSQASYCRLESGKSTFSLDQMYQAATALGMSGDEITSRVNNTISELRGNDIDVSPQLRANTTQVKNEGSPAAAFIVGAALAALLIGLLGKK